MNDFDKLLDSSKKHLNEAKRKHRQLGRVSDNFDVRLRNSVAAHEAMVIVAKRLAGMSEDDANAAMERINDLLETPPVLSDSVAEILHGAMLPIIKRVLGAATYDQCYAALAAGLRPEEG